MFEFGVIRQLELGLNGLEERKEFGDARLMVTDNFLVTREGRKEQGQYAIYICIYIIYIHLHMYM